jgi:hypothetical protein
MWAYKAWQGLHFPEHLPRAEQLPTYSTWCNAVEGNTTYYGLPAERTVTAWAREAPADFRFMFKLPRTITHEHHLRDVTVEMRAFLRRLEPLGERAEQLSIQLPPSFGPGEVDTLASFLRRLPSAHRFAVELRHRAFYEDARAEAITENLLQDAGVEWISLDTTTLYGTSAPSPADEVHAARSRTFLAGCVPSAIDRSCASSVSTTPVPPEPAGSRGCRLSQTGSGKGEHRWCSCTLPTTSPHHRWPDSSTPTSPPWSTRCRRFPSRTESSRTPSRPCSETRTGARRLDNGSTGAPTSASVRSLV